MGTFAWRIIGTGSAILAGVVANQVVQQLWKRSGRDALLDPRDPRTPWKDAVVFAAITGLAVGATRVVVTRKAARVYESATGELPPPMREGDA